jgi:uncharacterized protein YceH (UPF0502 family)
VLGTLAEKQRTVPDSYPLTLNALVSGCNQKTSRDPVMEATEAEVQAIIDSLKRYSMVMETSGGRVARYAHNLERALQVSAESAALLTALFLRGAQTSGELRIGCERLHRFADIAAVERCLNELAARPAGAFVVELPRLPGARENRWAHTLSGTPTQEATAVAASAPADVSVGELAAVKANVMRLETEVGELRTLVARICTELGIPSARE